MARRRKSMFEALQGHIQEFREALEPLFKVCPACGRPNRFKGMKRNAKMWPYCTKHCKQVEEQKTQEEFAEMVRAAEQEAAAVEAELDAEAPPICSSCLRD